MKFELKKEELINLTHDDKVLPLELTKQIGGGHNELPPGWISLDPNETGADYSCNKILLP